MTKAMYREALKRVSKLMIWDNKKTLLWMSTPNPFLGGVSPQKMFDMGRGHKVLSFIKGAEEEHQMRDP